MVATCNAPECRAGASGGDIPTQGPGYGVEARTGWISHAYMPTQIRNYGYIQVELTIQADRTARSARAGKCAAQHVDSLFSSQAVNAPLRFTRLYYIHPYIRSPSSVCTVCSRMHRFLVALLLSPARQDCIISTRQEAVHLLILDKISPLSGMRMLKAQLIPAFPTQTGRAGSTTPKPSPPHPA